MLLFTLQNNALRKFLIIYSEKLIAIENINNFIMEHLYAKEK